jgi:hypothetical protein
VALLALEILDVSLSGSQGLEDPRTGENVLYMETRYLIGNMQQGLVICTNPLPCVLDGRL